MKGAGIKAATGETGFWSSVASCCHRGQARTNRSNTEIVVDDFDMQLNDANGNPVTPDNIGNSFENNVDSSGYQGSSCGCWLGMGEKSNSLIYTYMMPSKLLFPLFLLVSLHLLYSCRSEETPTNTLGSGDSVAVDTLTVDTASVDTVVADTVPADTSAEEGRFHCRWTWDQLDSVQQTGAFVPCGSEAHARVRFVMDSIARLARCDSVQDCRVALNEQCFYDIGYSRLTEKKMEMLKLTDSLASWRKQHFPVGGECDRNGGWLTPTTCEEGLCLFDWTMEAPTIIQQKEIQDSLEALAHCTQLSDCQTVQGECGGFGYSLLNAESGAMQTLLDSLDELYQQHDWLISNPSVKGTLCLAETNTLVATACTEGLCRFEWKAKDN